VLKRRAAEAAKFVDPARLAISPQCGFASTVAGNPVTEADGWPSCGCAWRRGRPSGLKAEMYQ